MKIRNTRLITIIAVAIFLVCTYQMYWLVNQYFEIKERLKEDIQEVLRSSDFEELAHRVDVISNMNFKGRIDVNMGYDHRTQESVTQSNIKANNVTEKKTGTQTVVSPSSFGSILKSPKDLINIGLNMQRGIHSSLDAIKGVDIAFMDSIINIKLDSLGLDVKHLLIYKINEEQTEEIAIPTGNIPSAETYNKAQSDNTFILKISDNSEYILIIPHWHSAVLKKMIPIILFSLGTLVLLIITYIYLIHTMQKERELEEIKTDFTNNITHELKTPIAVAYAANDALLNFDSANNTPRMNRYLTVCQEQLRLLDRLVEQILSISMERNKPILFKFEVLEIDELLLSLTNTFKFKYPEKVNFHIKVEDGLVLSADRMHLSNIVSNLIDNAIKYSEGIADVTLKAYRTESSDCTIEIIDCGIGISSDQQKFIFDKFYRVPHGNIHDIKGYGLGLFYVKTMAEKLGVSVSVKSALGKGSCFKLVFNKKE